MLLNVKDFMVFSNYIMVEEVAVEFISDSEIIMPDSAIVSGVKCGKIISVPNGALIFPEFMPGNIVMFVKYAGTAFQANGHIYRFLLVGDILAIKVDRAIPPDKIKIELN